MKNLKTKNLKTMNLKTMNLKMKTMNPVVDWWKLNVENLKDHVWIGEIHVQ